MLRLFGGKSDHPMADIRSAQKTLEDLPKSDPLKALQELSAWIESVREQPGFRLDHQFAVLRLLDETARPFERRLTRDYYAAAGLSAFQEKRIWMALDEFFHQSAEGHAVVLARYLADDKGSSAVRPHLPLLAARGIGAATGRLKCAEAHYAAAAQAVWQRFADFYSCAEAQQGLDESLSPYPGCETSVRREFSAAMVWHGLCAGALGRLQGHLAERVLSRLARHFSVEAIPAENGLFMFDLQCPAPPVRPGATAAQPGRRFIAAADSGTAFDAWLGMLDRGAVPEELCLGAAYDAGVVRDVVRGLAERLAMPPKRRSVRHPIKVSVNVVSGFSGLLGRTDAGLDFGGGEAVWEIEDASIGGFRCVLPPAHSGALGIGTLLGVRPEKLARWGAGIVRRLRRDAQGNLHVGVEMLSGQVAGVRLHDPHFGEERPAIWLEGGEAGMVGILMGVDTYSGNRSLQAYAEGRRYLLMPLEFLEKGGDYDLVRYRCIEEDAGADAAF